jgi:type IV secretory pathway TrbF-like protein
MPAIQEPTNTAVTKAAERYLEQYGEPMVMNTYLKVAVLALSVVCLMLGALIYKSQKALASMHPMVIRVNSVGHADVIDYRNWKYKPQEVESKYYLARWATLYFGRDRYTIERDQLAALYFMNADVQQAVIRKEQKDKTIAAFQQDQTLPYEDIDVQSIELSDLAQSPYSARIDFEKVFTNPADHTVEKREHWIATVDYVFESAVKNEELRVNPLGLKIVHFRVDQSFQ